MEYVLFVLACLSSDPSQCVGERIALQGITNDTACHLAGQLTVTEWLREHEGMMLREAKCLSRPISAVAKAAKQ